MHCIGRKGRKTDSNILCPAGFRRTVLNPFTAMGNHSLACSDIQSLRGCLHTEHTFQDDSKFIEFRLLAGLLPSGGTLHPRNARRCSLRVHTADKLFDDLRLVACSLNRRWTWNQSRHSYSGLSGSAIVRHIWATGLLSLPRPSLGCLKCFAMISRNGSMVTTTPGSKA